MVEDQSRDPGGGRNRQLFSSDIDWKEPGFVVAVSFGEFPNKAIPKTDGNDGLVLLCVQFVVMPTDAEITFADHMGRFYAPSLFLSADGGPVARLSRGL